VTGVRRQQAPTRAHTPVIAPDPEHKNLTKIAPLAAWTKDQVWSYIREHELPYHALYDRLHVYRLRALHARHHRRRGRARGALVVESQTEIKECGLHWTASDEGTENTRDRGAPARCGVRPGRQLGPAGRRPAAHVRLGISRT